MTKTEHPPCRRCHGSGQEPGHTRTYGPRQLRLLEKLAELGGERAELQRRKAYMRSDGRRRYDQVIAQIRSSITAAEKLEVQTPDMMAALVLTSPAYYKIKNGQTAP